MALAYRGQKTVVVDQLGGMVRAKVIGRGEKYPDVPNLSPLRMFRGVNDDFFLKATEAVERIQQGGSMPEELAKLNDLLKKVK
ncbi:MAG: hypothetical protein FJY77_03770 [Candidatus Altiarchaeales archaeon]|nr:hypothetical protein [Candidatus Altiarchaeales archaeon]